MGEEDLTRQSTGIAGLDEILGGGLVEGRSYLLSGGPGTGKTILGLTFLTTGAAAGEKVLYITMEESERQLREDATTLGLGLEGVGFLDLSPDSAFFTQNRSYDLFSAAEVEQEPIARQIIARVESDKPQRVFLDSMTQFRYLASDAFQFRKQVLAFLRFMAENHVTVLASSEFNPQTPDDDLRFMCDGIVELRAAESGRSLRVTKFRGSDFRAGYHSVRLGGTGMQVFPRLVPATFRREFAHGMISSGLPVMDDILHGGLERGTVTILTGPTGTGKTTLGLQFMLEAAGRGEKSVVYTFEEGVDSIVHRCEGVDMPLRDMLDGQNLAIRPIEPLRFYPDEFAALVRRDVEDNGTTLIMIDSTAGYRLSFNDEEIESHLHALCKYLKNMGVTVLLTNEVEAVVGEFRTTDLGISYLADNILFIRYLEVEGVMSKAIGVLKKRLSDYEKDLREFDLTSRGLVVGDGKSLRRLQGMLASSATVNTEIAGD